ncbi:MAG TPA: TraB/GumN family protein [Albitalea sp.]
MTRPALLSTLLRPLLLVWLLLVPAAASAETVRSAACPPPAQAPAAERIEADPTSARDRGFLWRISKDRRTSYLYGTLHVARQEWMIPGATVMAALRASDVVALELDVGDPAILERLRRGMAFRPERALDDPLAERLRQQVVAACLPEQVMTAMAPEMLASSLLVLAARRDGLDPAFGIDAMVAGLGRGLDKPVVSLETPELQLQALLGRSREETAALVLQVVQGLESGQALPLLSRIAQVWADSRHGELERYEQWCDCVGTPHDRALYRRLLDDRNPALAERIDALHTAGRRVFAAVGSLHMVGGSALPALLAQRGYAVERVDFAATPR